MAFQKLWKGTNYTTTGTNTSIASYANSVKACIEFYSIASKESAKFLPLDVEYSETLASEWNHVQVYGRNDPLSTFQGTKRTISLSFVVSADSTLNALDNMIEISNLMTLMYPTYDQNFLSSDDRPSHRLISNYNNASQINTAPLLKVHFNNLIVDPSATTSLGGSNNRASSVGLVCAANGVQVNPIFDDGVFVWGPSGKANKRSTASDLDQKKKKTKVSEMNKRKGKQTDIRIYPKYYKISTELTVYHTFPLGFHRVKGKTRDRAMRPGFGSFPYGEQHVLSGTKGIK